MFELTSYSFKNGDPIPEKFTQEGENISPSIEWTDVPEGAMELALICDDPDAPQAEPFVHWVVYGIDPAEAGLNEALPKMAVLNSTNLVFQGKNSSGAVGYIGPRPPLGHGWHHYQFHMYALRERLGLEPGASAAQLREAMKNKIIAEAELVGRYVRGAQLDHRLNIQKSSARL